MRRAIPYLWDQYSREKINPVRQPKHRPKPRAWAASGLHAAWLGHSTVLLKIDGITVLTDPVFSNRVGLNLGLGRSTERVRAHGKLLGHFASADAPAVCG